jgi:hypothetical protein
MDIIIGDLREDGDILLKRPDAIIAGEICIVSPNLSSGSRTGVGSHS